MSQNLPVLSSTHDIINQLIRSGEIDIRRLKRVERGVRETSRVYERQYETVYETEITTVEILTFE